MPTSHPSLKFNDSLTLMYYWVGGFIEGERHSAGEKNQALLKVPFLWNGPRSIPEAGPTFVINMVKYQIACLSNECPPQWVFMEVTNSQHPLGQRSLLGPCPFFGSNVFHASGWLLVGFEQLQRSFVPPQMHVCINTHSLLVPPFRKSTSVNEWRCSFCRHCCSVIHLPLALDRTRLTGEGCILPLNPQRLFRWRSVERMRERIDEPMTTTPKCHLMGSVPWICLSKISRNRVSFAS